MNKTSLKDYLSKVLELETAIYIQMQIIEKFNDYRKSNIPEKPEILLPNEPEQVSEQEYFDDLWIYFDDRTHTEFLQYLYFGLFSFIFALIFTYPMLVTIFNIDGTSIDKEAVRSMFLIPVIAYTVLFYCIRKFIALKKETYQRIDEKKQKI